MKLVADFLIAQRGIKLFSCNRRWHTYNSNSSAGSSCMNDIHQMPTETTFLVSRVNENSSNHVTVETGSTNNVFAQQGYENPALSKVRDDGFRRKALLNLSDHIRRVVL